MPLTTSIVIHRRWAFFFGGYMESKRGRPHKDGIDYFRFYVDQGPEFDSICESFGNDGFVFMVRFWIEACRTSSGIVDLSGIRKDMFRKKCKIRTLKFDQILDACIQLNIVTQLNHTSFTSRNSSSSISSVLKEREKRSNIVDFGVSGDLCRGINREKIPLNSEINDIEEKRREENKKRINNNAFFEPQTNTTNRNYVNSAMVSEMYSK